MAAGAGSAAIAAPAACFPHGGFEESTTASRQLCSTRTAASQGSLMKGVPLGSLLHPFGMGLPKLPCCPGAEARPPPKSALEPGLRELNPAPLRCGVAPRTVRSKSLHALRRCHGSHELRSTPPPPGRVSACKSPARMAGLDGLDSGPDRRKRHSRLSACGQGVGGDGIRHRPGWLPVVAPPSSVFAAPPLTFGSMGRRGWGGWGNSQRLVHRRMPSGGLPLRRRGAGAGVPGGAHAAHDPARGRAAEHRHPVRAPGAMWGLMQTADLMRARGRSDRIWGSAAAGAARRRRARIGTGGAEAGRVCERCFRVRGLGRSIWAAAWRRGAVPEPRNWS